MRTVIPSGPVRLAMLFLAATATLGLLMRLDIVTGVLSSSGIMFTNLRHAHSHAGFYGVLTLGWWITAAQARAPLVPWRAFHLHAATSAAASALFALMGYGVVTISLSTVVAGFWMFAAYRTYRTREAEPQWRDAAPLGILVGVTLVPAVALTARTNPAFSRELAHVFIAIILFCVFIPAAWQALGMKRAVPVAVYVVTMAAFSVASVFSTGPEGLLVSLLASAVMTAAVRHAPKPLLLLWYALAASLALTALFPMTAALRLASIHFVILGPVLCSFAIALLPTRISRAAGAAYLMTLLFMLAAIVAPTHAPAMVAAVSALFALTLFNILVRAWPSR